MNSEPSFPCERAALSDVAHRPPLSLVDGQTIELGEHRIRHPSLALRSRASSLLPIPAQSRRRTECLS